MLYLDAPITIRGITVFRDYNDKSLFYFLPGSPRLSTEAGQPMFQLLMYRDVGTAATGVQGGGFLIMTTDLGVAPGVLDQVKQELGARFGVSANLTPVPVKTGSVRVTILDSAPIADNAAHRDIRFVENVVANSAPSLYGDERAAFTAELSRQGAVLLRSAIRGEGATPVVVVYDLQYVGLLPAYNLKITIDFHQAYDYLRTRAQANTLWFKSDIDQEMESLRKSGAIKIEEIVGEPQAAAEDPAARLARVNALAKELAQWTFFKPGLNPGAVLATDRGTLTAYDSTTDLSKITAGLTSQSKAALTGVGASEDAGAPRRPGAGVATSALESGQTAAATTPAAPAAAPAAAEPPTAVEAWNRAGRPQGAYMLKQLSQEERQTIVYEFRQVNAVERSIAPQGQIRMLEGATNLRGRIQEVDLNADFFKTIEGTITTTADLAAMGVASANVKIRYGTKPDGHRWKDEDEAVLKAAGDSKAYRFFVDHLGTREIEYQVVLTNRPDAAIGHDASTEESPWIPTTTRNLNINPLSFSSVMRVHVEAAMVDWNLVKQIQAHIIYEDQHAGIAAADTRILTKDAATALVPIRPKDPRVRDVTVAATFFYADGATEIVTQRHDGGEPFVINQPPDSTTVVDITLADILERYKRITVQLARGAAQPPDVKQTVTLGPDTITGRWSFRRAQPQDVGFAYRATSFLKDGSIQEGAWVTTDNPLLIVGDRAIGVLSVRVMLLGTLAEAGMRMAKVELTYPDAPAWADSHTEQLLQGTATEFSWRVPMGRVGANAYTYKVTWFKNDGTRVTTGPQTTTDEILLLDPLAP
jgi:hypothetical protein